MNKEPSYPTFLHLFSPDSIVEVEVAGRGSAISYVGFGPKGDNKSQLTKLLTLTLSSSDMTPAPSVGFNLTYVCPEGMVFNHDWFASPFVMMTCQVKSGS